MKKIPPVPLREALDGLDAVYDPGTRPERSQSAGLELARAVVEYFGPEPIDRLLTSDIALRDCALAIVAIYAASEVDTPVAKSKVRR